MVMTWKQSVGKLKKKIRKNKEKIKIKEAVEFLEAVKNKMLIWLISLMILLF